MKKWLQQLFKKEPGQKLSKRVRYTISIGLLGVGLLIIANLFSSSPDNSGMKLDKAPTGAISEEEQAVMSESARGKPKEAQELEESYEEELVRMLDKVQGISQVEVMVNLDSTNMQVYEKNLVSGKQTTDETDTNGGARIIEDNTEETQTVLVRQGDQEVPLLVHTKKPRVRGVFIIAKGAEKAEARKSIVESVSRVLDVPTHRVSVIPKK